MTYWKDKVVVITGGSSGLGLAFAKTLSQRGARLALVARDEQRLADAVSQLDEPGRVVCLPADITNAEDVARLPSQVVESLGRVDVLINCAGKSGRGEILKTKPTEFEELWQLNFLALVRCTQAFAPLLEETHGHVVNIGSLASKVASRYLGGYASSKFPVAAFSQQLRLELAGKVHVLLVCPGPIKRADAGMRYENTNVPEAAKQPGGGARVKGLEPDYLVNQTLLACERRKVELLLPRKARLLLLAAAIHPGLGDWLLSQFTSK